MANPGGGMSANYEEIREQLLHDNCLIETVKSFEASEDRVWYCDCPVLEPDKILSDEIDGPLCETAIRLGLDLLRDWSRSSTEVTSVLTSEPFLRIDDNWLQLQDQAPPPSVNICLAKTPELLQSGSFDIAIPKKLEFDYEIDLSDMEVRQIDGFGGGHSWLLRTRQP